MSTLHPFPALRPPRELAARVSSAKHCNLMSKIGSNNITYHSTGKHSASIISI